MRMAKCTACGENEATLKLVATDNAGKELDSMEICNDCTDETIIELLPGCEDARPKPAGDLNDE